MKAAISFTLYKDFSKYIILEGWNADYSKAIEELNKYVKKLVDNDDLAITYDGKPTEIILPIEENNCGNIFGEKPCPFWESVEIWCKFPYAHPSDFMHDKLSVEKCPPCWDAERSVW